MWISIRRNAPRPSRSDNSDLNMASATRWSPIILGLVVLIYATLAGLRTVTDYDLGWQLATGRWVAQHHQIPSTDVLSSTAAGQCWIYPVGSGLLFYAVFLLGNYAALSWLGAAACTGTAAILLRRGSAVSAVLAIVAIPLIAARTTPRADMFSVVLFAAFLTVLWQQHETGRARLWLLPILMIAWVNLHPGFVAGLTLLGSYVGVESLEMVWPGERRQAAARRLRQGYPWLLATVGATLVNPWGWGIYRVLFRQRSVMASHSQLITEWASVRLNWTTAAAALSARLPRDAAFFYLLLVVIVAAGVALLRRQLGAAALLVGAAVLAVQHLRLHALFGLVVVVVGSAVLTPGLAHLQLKIEDAKVRSILALGATCLVLVLVSARSVDLVTDRVYMGSTDLGSFGTGLSWWFPEGAAAFIERENIPGQIFNSYPEGGYVAWRLGPRYRDYIDGRAIPFGPEISEREEALQRTPPDSPEWRREAERYDINTIILPLARYDALQFFPVLPEFCSSDIWRPVYLDEVSVVFVRRRAETENLVDRFAINCATAPLPRQAAASNGSIAFNQLANAAAVLHALGRSSEAFAATTKAMTIFPDSAFIHFLRATLLVEAGNTRDAEQHYRTAAALEPTVVSWVTLAQLYSSQGRLSAEIDAWERASELSPRPGVELLSLGYAYLDAQRPRDALQAFGRVVDNLPMQAATVDRNFFLARVAHGRAMAWTALGDFNRAATLQEETVRLAPDRSEEWLALAKLYERSARFDDARRARERAVALATGGEFSGSKR